MMGAYKMKLDQARLGWYSSFIISSPLDLPKGLGRGYFF